MIARIVDFSVRRRWLVLLVVLVAAATGFWSLTKLPIDAVPDVTNVQVQVNATAPALTPLEIEKQVTVTLETALAGIPGLESTRSFSRNGFAQVTVVFVDGTNIYFARQLVAERINNAKSSFPSGVEVKMGPVSTGLGEIYWWAVEYEKPGTTAPVRDGAPGWQTDGSYLTPQGERLTDDFQRTVYLRTVQDWIVRPQMKTVPGVAGADAIGGFVKQYQVQPDPQKLIAYGLSLQQVVAAIEANNASRGANYIEQNGEGYVVRAAGRVENIEDIGQIVVSTRNGVPVRVKDVADVTIGKELRTGSASVNGREVVLGTALMLIGGNSRTVAAAAAAKIEDISKTLPPGIQARTVLNRTQLVDATIHTVATNLAEGALLVIAVLFLMLGNFRAALITACVIPITMLLTATGMLRGHISANLMSLGALDFGLIVDGAVIICENSLRHLAERQVTLGRVLTRDERLKTITDSAVEMIRPTVYGQLIIILVYVPLLAFTGVEGKTFEPMALTVMIALATAFVVSLTFIPAATAIALTRPVRESENVLVRWLKDAYRPILSRSIASPGLVLTSAALLFAVSLVVLSRLGQEFTPTLDEKNIVMEVKRVPSTALSQSQAMQLDIEKVISKFPQVAFVFSRTGTPDLAADPMPPSASDTYIIVKPQSDWPDPSMTKDDLIRAIEAEAAKLPGNKVGFSQPIEMRFNELIAGVREDLGVKVFGDDFSEMQRTATRIADVLKTIEGAESVKVEETSGLPFLEIRIDKAEIARRGLSLTAVQDMIEIAVGGRQAGLVFQGDRRFQIVVRLNDALRGNISALESLPVPLPHLSANAPAATVPLREIASFEQTEGANQISRENGKRRVVATAEVRGRDIGSLVTEAQDKVAEQVKLPPGSYLAWGGQFENFSVARQRLAIVVPACFAMIFLLLFGALGSARDAVLVFSAVPLALTGGIAALWLRGMPFSISAAVGFIALSGVAVLNGLVMLTQIRSLIDGGTPLAQAIRDGALTRFRPVVMTALVASLGFVPMALATGTGAEVQKPLATVVIGGLLTATVLTLVVLPALYARFAKRPTIDSFNSVGGVQRAAE
ncbi:MULTISPECIES: efflux RND transporter permease subunit [Bradyrhizobium]|jgi:heavy metal efflux system protein|uniref:efflux RND transporter permease subunit n=1 Tax=Bradyrhizobium TaxID=374 RepID=UPI0004872EB6|nr:MULTISPECIES: CusA/CzcA family heavy metal efflux RND transporter [Bradyrhizobium]MCS3445788.1 cobalt-zinc-cadmium resistance protein CzcA [Bradyrhizobium elkanii]MCS3563081.1 cobalt-zinc-cadmium resistance protein CzcA [Bradyrhizobium elkanii]MCW2147084.1 cobalt-zinc-cadmium resistance protein CzcA [Bradyrhizobium elkanii]MCW2353841.1 cobalt-zinc-cadmium resistance protein CzcA [Bradyrhizobium elkanii]MCW2379914.1 cobalt-zinc-cadmium resistance protein CzcA [Bradyrhizobium elkanii]